jgi:outer membrane receptor protein involved in Fe transport
MYSLKIFFCFFIAINITLNSFSQNANSNNGDFEILAIDSFTKEAVVAANVLVTNKQKTFVYTALTDTNGRYTFTKPSLKDYPLIITISHINYLLKTVTIENLSLALTFTLKKTNSKTLKDITIISEKKLVEDQGDKLVYNADQDISNSNGDATEVLRRTPMVTVDMGGNAGIRGSTSVKILLNGKPVSNLSTSMILKMIPAYIIKKVEVITSPSAKYEAEGAAGIINIITTRKIVLGFSGLINAGAGTRGSHLFGLLNYSKNKLALTAGTGSYWFYTRSSGSTEVYNKTSSGKQNVFEQGFDGKYNGGSINAKMQATYEIDEKNFIETEFVIFRNSTNPVQNTNIQFFDSVTGNALPDLLFTRASKNTTKGTSFTLNTSYTRKFAVPQKELSAVLVINSYHSVNDYYYKQNNRTFLLDELSKNPGSVNEANLQFDYQQPSINQKHLYEVGFRGIIRQMKNSYDILQDSSGLTGGAYTFFSANGYLDYEQKIGALYITDKFKLSPKITLRGGVRLETVENILQNNEIGNKYFKDRYTNLFPNAGFSWTLDALKSISGNYSYRLQRPSINHLNPASNRMDAYTTYSGNPDLRPEFTHNIELSLSLYVKTSYFRITPYFRTTSGIISTVTVRRTDGFRSYYENAGKANVTGLSLWATVNLTKKWLLNCSNDLNYTTISNNVLALKNSGLFYTANLNTSYKISKTITAQLFGVFYTPKILLQGTEGTYSYSNFAIRKEFNRKRSSFSLSIDNPFTKGFVLNINNKVNTLITTDRTTYYNRGFRLMFSHRFGNAIQEPSKKSSIDSDLKSKDNGIINQNIN